MFFDHHTALALAHLGVTTIFYAQGSLAEAIAALVIAAIYAVMPPVGH